MIDHEYMARAIQLAERGRYTTAPNPNVGCVIVRDGRVVGEGYHRRAGQAHAEILALQQADAAALGATVYVTLEPCCHFGRTPPCVDALIAAQVARVVVAMSDPNPQVAGQGIGRLRAAGVEVSCGVLEHVAAGLNSGFLLRMRMGRPWVRVKLAMSLDGRTALASGESRWLSSDAARRDVQFWRARSGAVLTGIGTVLADDPSLNVRLTATELQVAGEPRQPLRVILDPDFRVAANARTLRLPGERVVLTSRDDAKKAALLDAQGTRVRCVPGTTERLDLAAVMSLLAELEINEVQVEAGAKLAGALLAASLVDECLIYVAPHCLGDTAQGLFRLPEVTRMADRMTFRFEEVRAVAGDLRVRARPLQTVSEGYPLPRC